MTTETPQARMKETLEQTGIPYKRIEVFGSQILVTAWSETAARRWVRVLSRFATVRGMAHSMEATQDDTKIRKANPGLVKSKFYHDVWRVGARI